MTELTAQTAGPECYVRTNITKNTKGYSYETTVSLRWDNQLGTMTERFMLSHPIVGGGEMTRTAEGVLADLQRMADAGAREEIARRQALDEGGVE